MTSRTAAEAARGGLVRLVSPVLDRCAHLLVRLLLPLAPPVPAEVSAPAPAGRTRVTFVPLGVHSMGGTTRTVLSLAGFLSAHYDVRVVAVHRRRRKPFFRFPAGVTVTALDDPYRPRGRLHGRLAAVLGRCPSVLIHMQDSRYRSFSLWTDVLLLRYLRAAEGVVITARPGLSLVAARHAPPAVRTIGQEHLNLSTHRPLLRAAIRRHYPGLDALAVLTATDRRDYAALFAAGRPPVLHLPNAVPPLPGGRADLSSRVAVAAGRLTEQKGFDRLIPAWAPVAAAYPDWRLEIYGNGPERARLESLIDEHGLRGSVHLRGRSNQLGEVLSRSSLFVLSSRHEGLPMVILEAMSKGLPVVAFDCPTGPAEVVATGVNGVLVPDGDVAGLTRALLDVVADRELREKLGSGAAQTAADYDLDAIGARWKEVIDRLVTEPASRQRLRGGR